MKNVLITGASRGIGFETAKKFLEDGHQVYCTSRDLLGLKKLRLAHPKTCKLIHLNLQDDKSIRELVEDISGIKLDVVIHNAGLLVNKPFQEITKEELFACYQVNILGPFELQQQLISHLKDDAHTIFISSVGGFQGSVKFPGLSAYSSSKAAIVNLTELLQEEFKESSLAFNCLCLGAVQTEMLENAFPGYQAPLNPEDMAAFIYQFSTHSHKFMRGKVIPVSLSTP